MTISYAELSRGISRKEIHHRRIDMRGYERSDGLFEVQAHLTDRKPHDFTPPGDSRTVPAHAPVHDIKVTIVFDEDLLIHAVDSAMDAYPYLSCPGGGDTLGALVGLHIGRGWASEVRKRLPACDSCTHIREMLIPMASAAYQTLTMLRSHLFDQRDADGWPVKIDSCHAYGRSRELVRRLWPTHYRPDDPDGNAHSE